jgi:hypothetical protein
MWWFDESNKTKKQTKQFFFKNEKKYAHLLNLLLHFDIMHIIVNN